MWSMGFLSMILLKFKLFYLKTSSRKSGIVKAALHGTKWENGMFPFGVPAEMCAISRVINNKIIRNSSRFKNMNVKDIF